MKFDRIHHRRAGSRRGEAGYILIMILLVAALMVIALTAAAPRIAQQIKRDREVEMFHRGDQYSRAVKKYYAKFKRFPTSIDQLENTNNIRFLRKRYKDPMTPEGNWKIVHVGEVQLGQGSTIPGAIPAGAAGLGGSTGTGAGGSSTTPPQPGATGGSTSGTQSPATTPGTTGTGSTSGFGGQTFGGGAMMGVVSTSEAEGIHEVAEKKKYNEWFFIYDPAQDRPGLLLKGPYNPKATFGGTAGGGIPGAVNPGQLSKPSGPTPPAPAPPTGSNPTPSPAGGNNPPQ